MDFKNLRLILPVAGIVIGGAAFAGGMATEKALSGPYAGQTASSRLAPGASGQMPNSQGSRPTMGSVTAVNGLVITVADVMSGATSKVTLTDSSTVTDGTATANVGDIKVGVTIAAFGTTESDGALVATQVQINPVMGPGGSGGMGAAGTSTVDSAAGTGI